MDDDDDNNVPTVKGTLGKMINVRSVYHPANNYIILVTACIYSYCKPIIIIIIIIIIFITLLIMI